MRIRLAFICVLLGTAAASSAVLSEKELNEKIVGKTCNWTNGKASGTSSYAADGVAKVTMPNGAMVGTWRIQGNRICDKYKDRKKGKESCFTFDETSPGTYKGSIGFTATCN